MILFIGTQISECLLNARLIALRLLILKSSRIGISKFGKCEYININHITQNDSYIQIGMQVDNNTFDVRKMDAFSQPNVFEIPFSICI